MQTRLYLDHAATTTLLPEARAALERGLDAWANPNSPHAEGRASRALLEEARSTIAEVLGWRHDVIFTSGASEAVEIAAGYRVINRKLETVDSDNVFVASDTVVVWTALGEGMGRSFGAGMVDQWVTMIWTRNSSGGFFTARRTALSSGRA